MMLLLLSFLFENGIMMSSTQPFFFFLTGICYDDACHLKKNMKQINKGKCSQKIITEDGKYGHGRE